MTALLTEHRASLNAIATELLDKETIVLDDMTRIIHNTEHPEEAPIPETPSLAKKEEDKDEVQPAENAKGKSGEEEELLP